MDSLASCPLVNSLNVSIGQIQEVKSQNMESNDKANQRQIKDKVNDIFHINKYKKSLLYKDFIKNKNVFDERPGCHKSFVYHKELKENIIVKAKQYPNPI